ncbi:MAG: alpha/beta hydrolase [Pseudomonadota bacterium]
MTPKDLEAEYDNRAMVPEHEDIMAGWAKASATARDTLKCDLDIAYGSHARQRFDLFHGQSRGGRGRQPHAVYIHGGYWKRGDRKDYSFVAEALVQRGVSVALPSYRLCPEVTVSEIIDDLHAFMIKLWERTDVRPVVIGHSAGGHLAGAMLAKDWSDHGLPGNYLNEAISISGLFDLHDLIDLENGRELKLTAQSARRASPLFWTPPPKSARFIAAVGALESRAFIAQSLGVAQAWSDAGVKAACVVVPGANHFSVVNTLANPDSALVERAVEMAKTAAART